MKRYLHLFVGLRNVWYVSAWQQQRWIEAAAQSSEREIRILCTSKYCLFRYGVIVIYKHWKIHHMHIAHIIGQLYEQQYHTYYGPISAFHNITLMFSQMHFTFNKWRTKNSQSVLKNFYLLIFEKKICVYTIQPKKKHELFDVVHQAFYRVIGGAFFMGINKIETKTF